MKSILDPSFRYTSSLQTNVRKTFERVRRELQQDTARATARTERPSQAATLQGRYAAAR